MVLTLLTQPGAGLALACGAALLLGLFALLRPVLHTFQLESYRAGALLKYYAHRPQWLIRPGIAVIAGLCGWQLVPRLAGSWLPFAEFVGMAVFFAAAAGLAAAVRPRAPVKKPLVYTHRVIRLVTAAMVLAAVEMALYAFFIPACGWLWVLLLPAVTLPLWLSVAHMVMLPVEKAIQAGFKRKAARKLAEMPQLTVIGITGSYGKTSTKFILASILSQKYRTLATPQSFNTPMGVCRAISEYLDDTHRVFICEMGARRPGEIAELCRLVHPAMGLITSVGPQHLETFHTEQAVANTKFELIAHLPEGGAGFLPHDHSWCDQLYQQARPPRYQFGLEDTSLYATATNITTGPFGSRFDLIIDGQTVAAQTCLLGRHNITNIVGAAAVARQMGLTMQQIARGISQIQPIAHRLQIVRNDGITVIDDAFNASPHGVRAALEVLAGFDGRKVLVTPGLVELGEREQAENAAFGAAIAPVADLVILVGQTDRVAAIHQGYLQAGGRPDAVRFANTLADATQQLGQLLQLGDVVLFENDLPDHLA